jgi:transcriptional regulator with XRE-family HTH domain
MDMKLGEAIKARREQLGMTQKDLAEKLYVSRQTVCRWENGSRCPDIVMCKKISMVLDVALDELISEETVSEYVPEKESSLDISCVKVMLTGILLLILATFLYVVYDGESNSFVYCFVLGLAIFVIGLFIPWEKRKAVQEDQLPQRTCPQCGKNHDFDYPQCPYCGNRYET